MQVKISNNEKIIPKIFIQVNFTGWNYNKLLEIGFCYYSMDNWYPRKTVKFPLCHSVKDLPDHLHNVYFKAVLTFNDSELVDKIDASDSLKNNLYP